MADPTLPKTCPACGATDSYVRRTETGGGWRTVYRCSNCGRRHTGSGDDTVSL